MMNARLIKALLLSALVIPGAGQLYLRRFKTGLTLLGIILICFVIMINSVMTIAMSAVEQIQMQGNGIVNMAQVTQAATEATHQSSNAGFSLAVTLIVLCWVYSLVDIIVAGRRLAQQA